MRNWYIIGAIVVIALAVWYFYGRQVPSVGPSALEEASALSSDNTMAAISAELSATPDDTAALSQDAAASEQSVSGF
ncbi:MAG: hypothetical protein WA058_03955 [Minisyncoccia bacterium]